MTYLVQLTFYIFLGSSISSAADLPRLASISADHRISWKTSEQRSVPSALCNFESFGFHKVYSSEGFGYFFEDSVYSNKDNKAFIFQSSSMALNSKKKRLLSLGKGGFLYWQPPVEKRKPLLIMTDGVSKGTLRKLLKNAATSSCSHQRKVASELVSGSSTVVEGLKTFLSSEVDAISQKQNWVDALSGCFIDGLGSVGVSLWQEGAWGYASRLYMETLGKPFEEGITGLIQKYRENPEGLTINPMKLYKLHKAQIKDLKENLWPILDAAYGAATNGIKNFTELPQRDQSKIICQLGAGAAGGTGSIVLLKSLKKVDFLGDLKHWASIEGEKRRLAVPSSQSYKIKRILSEMPSLRISQTQALRHRVRAEEGPEFMFLPRPDARDWAAEKGKIREFPIDSKTKVNLEPGAYNYVVRKNGDLVVGRLDHRGEFGVRHSSLANEQEVVAAGQLKIGAEESPIFNVRSGTFSKKLAEAQEESLSYEPKVEKLFSSYLQKPVTRSKISQDLGPKKKPTFFDMIDLCKVPSFQAANRKKCCQLFKIGCEVL